MNELKRVTGEGDILEMPPRTLQGCPGEVRIHPAMPRSQRPTHVRGDAATPQRLLFVQAAVSIATASSRWTCGGQASVFCVLWRVASALSHPLTVRIPRQYAAPVRDS